MKNSLITLLAILCFNLVNAQVYTKKQTRHRFAQMHLGLDYQTNFGGTTTFQNAQGQLETMDLQSLSNARFLIGGTHFWGHADFYVAIPIYAQTMMVDELEINYSTGIETVFKYYPWRIENDKIRPFIGTSLAPFYFRQINNNLTFPNGGYLSRVKLPLTSGVTFNHKSHLLEVGLMYNYANQEEYYISQTEEATIKTPPLFATLSYRFMFETTLGAERNWESGQTAAVTEKLASEGKLDGFFLAAGMSSTWWLGNSTYNEENRVFIPNYGISVMPEFSAGYYWHQPDMSINLAYRGYAKGVNVYGVSQTAKRRSLALEATKTVGDYHGFAPFIGPVVSYENLSFSETTPNELPFSNTQSKLGYGLTFGWDIRPNRLMWFTLRTNLRYFPNLKFDAGNDQTINFNNVEFNFIQMVVYPGRM
jgi:hypothetical protein